MAAGNNVHLMSAQLIDSDATTVTAVKSIPIGAVELIITSTVSGRTDGTFTTTVQHSPDGVNWFTLGATAAQSADGMVILAVTVNCFHIVRASVLSATTTDGANVDVKLWYSLR